MDPSTFELLQKANWGEIGKELLAFAVWRAQNYMWRSGEHWELAAGRTVEDLVQEVITKTIEGERKWNPNKGQLGPWLKDQIKSVMDALSRSAAHRYEVGIPETEDEEVLRDVVEYRAVRTSKLESPSPEEVLLENEMQEDTERKIAALFRAAEEPDLQEVLGAVIDGCESKPRYLAAALGVPVEDINNRLKRLRRRALELMEGEGS